MNNTDRWMAAVTMTLGMTATSQAAVIGPDFVYVGTDTFVGALPTEYAADSLSRSYSSTSAIGTGFASLADGVLRAYVQGNGGTSQVIVGLGTRIYLSGATDSGGEVIVTMAGEGTWGQPSPLASIRVQATSGYGLGYPTRGYDVFAGGPPAIYDSGNGITTTCIGCTNTPGELLPFTISSHLPFAAGQTYVDYTAQLLFGVSGFNWIDARNTARFSITAPTGVNYASALTFTAAPQGVPEPATIALSLAGLGLIGATTRRRLPPSDAAPAVAA